MLNQGSGDAFSREKECFMEQKRKKGILSLILAICMIFGTAALDTGTVLADSAGSFDPNANGTKHQRAEAPALIITGQDASEADGFAGNYLCLTEAQLNSVNSEESAKQYFPKAESPLYLENVTYSYQTKEAKGGWGTQTISGLNLTAIAASMGIDVTKDMLVYSKGSDGHTGTLYNAFTQKRYAFPSENAADEEGRQVYPAIALESPENQSEMPRLVFGQVYSGEYNMLNWEKWLQSVQIGGRPAVLTLSLGGETKTFTLAEIIGTKSGRYTSVYQYTDGGRQVTANVTGIPLDKLLSDAGFSGISSVTIDGGTTISAAQLSKYFMAYDAEENGEPVSGSSQLMLYGPGTTKEQVVNASISQLKAAIAAPAAVTGLKAAKNSYNSVKLTWKKVSGAQGYNIYRYNSSKKKYALWDCVEGASKVSYIDRSLKTGTKYTYKIKAYKTVGSVDLESAFSSAASAVPALSKTAVKLSKSGKTAIKAKWSKVAGANGYQLRMGTNKKMTKGKKTYTISKASTTSKKLTKLKKGKRYYVKVRPYRKVSGKKVYGVYSAVKSIKR